MLAYSVSLSFSKCLLIKVFCRYIYNERKIIHSKFTIFPQHVFLATFLCLIPIFFSVIGGRLLPVQKLYSKITSTNL